MLNDGHGSYTYYSAIYANQIDKLLEDYKNLPVKIEMDKYNLEVAIVDRYMKSQQSLIDLFANGPAISNESIGLMKGLNNYNEFQNSLNNINGNYMDTNVQSKYNSDFIARYIVPYIHNNKVSGLDISMYIDLLRSGVDMR